ncbi:hypothetical protein [Pollutibacter soli]|uniref:hypothetical protein n=1 Tax=Pollutibacter soli TaxID=3034157 RepID=UPI003013C10D
MHTIIFIAYLMFFSWLITRIRFNRKSELAPVLLVFFFVFRVITGCIYGWVHSLQPDYQTTMDTWKFFSDGLNETKLLINDPAAFFKELVRNPYQGGFGRFFSTSDSYWNDLKHNIMIKFAGILNLFSGSNYYVNIIFYNFIVFFGPVALYRSVRYFTSENKNIYLFLCFLFPTTVFWTCGFHKEGLLFTSVSLIIFYCLKAFYSTWRWTSVLMIIFLFGLIFLLRNNIIFALVPAWLLWMLSHHFPKKTQVIFVSGVVFFLLLFFTSKYFIPRLDLPESVRQRQIEFMLLGGNTYVQMDTLQPNVMGFVKHLPIAADMAFLRPHPGEGSFFYIPFTIESVTVIVFAILALTRKRKPMPDKPFLYFMLMYAIGLLLLIGYTITNTGAVIRYRSIAFPFLLMALALIINWSSFRKNRASIKF